MVEFGSVWPDVASTPAHQQFGRRSWSARPCTPRLRSDMLILDIREVAIDQSTTFQPQHIGLIRLLSRTVGQLLVIISRPRLRALFYYVHSGCLVPQFTQYFTIQSFHGRSPMAMPSPIMPESRRLGTPAHLNTLHSAPSLTYHCLLPGLRADEPTICSD